MSLFLVLEQLSLFPVILEFPTLRDLEAGRIYLLQNLKMPETCFQDSVDAEGMPLDLLIMCIYSWLGIQRYSCRNAGPVESSLAAMKTAARCSFQENRGRIVPKTA